MGDERRCIWVLAGTNGAGKSSIAGALLRQSGGDYWNPDEVARTIREKNPLLDQTEANAAAWALGLRKLDDAIAKRREFFFETTLGGDTMTARLERALAAGHEVRIWYAGLESPELHVERVLERVRAGGHAIPEADIRRRYDGSRRNLARLLPKLTELKVFDNTKRADPKRGRAPKPILVLHWKHGKIIAPANLRRTPDWAKPIVAQGIKHAG